jgi:hypothetical protein
MTYAILTAGSYEMYYFWHVPPVAAYEAGWRHVLEESSVYRVDDVWARESEEDV